MATAKWRLEKGKRGGNSTMARDGEGGPDSVFDPGQVTRSMSPLREQLRL